VANQTIQNSIDYSQTYTQYSPLNVGNANEPAITIANEIQNLVAGPPFTWGWNRNEDSSKSTTKGVQDYVINLTDFAFLEDVTLTDQSGVAFDVPDIYNTKSLGVADANVSKQARPNAACVILVTYGTSMKLRFMGVPDQTYLITLTYQKLITPMSALTGNTGTWTIPAQYSDIYNSLFLGEAMSTVDDARANIYRQRGVTALLAKAEGLTELQKNAFLEQYWMRQGRSDMMGTLKTQQATQARGV
jgi:hypothetical protein